MTGLVGIRNLRVMRDKRLVLEIEQLFIEKNKVVALVGPKGAGKSTLILVLAGLLRPQRGEIRFDGKVVEPSRERSYRRRIGLVLQDPLLLNMSVYENVATGLRFRSFPRLEEHRRVEEWLERLHILNLRRRPASQLSGGEAQRVALARAFVLQPELLLLDEPFNSLDRKMRKDLLAELKTIIPEADTTTIFSTHDDREVDLLADEKIELLDGRHQPQPV